MFSKVRIKISGVNSNTPSGSAYSSYRTSDNCEYRDGQMNVNYIWGISQADYDFDANAEQWSSYTVLSENKDIRNIPLFVLNYKDNQQYRITREYGLCPLTEEGNRFSFYRREYQAIGRYGDQNPTIIKGEWEPVAINITSGRIRDFNITNNRSYQYISE